MAYVECMKSELDLFKKLPVQASILGTEEVSYKPIASLDNPNVIEFVSLGYGDTYRDLSSIYLKLRVQILGAADAAITDESVGVANNVLHSLIQKAAVYMNGKPISQTDSNYQYRAYIEVLLNYGNDASTTHLETIGWKIDSGDLEPDKVNNGLTARKKMFGKSAIIELIGKVHCDMFNQNKLLLNNVDLRIVFTMEKPEFYIIEKAEGKSHIKILDATLFMNHVTISPEILLAHQQLLSKTNAVYPYKRIEVKSFTVSSGTTNLQIDNVVIGQLPNFLVFGMIDNESYTGTRTLNPYHFKHNNITQFNLVVNGVQVPSHPFQFDYTSKQPPISSRGYLSLFKGTGIHFFDKGHQITKQLYDNGFFLIAFDLTSDNSYGSECSSLLNQGNIRISGRFSEALPKTISCIVYAEFNANLQIDYNRNVYTDF